jgi:hypothetical protein
LIGGKPEYAEEAEEKGIDYEDEEEGRGIRVWPDICLR